MRKCVNLLAGFSVALCAAMARGQASQQVSFEPIVSDFSKVAPGEPFHLGIQMNLAPGWHVYWINPGDSGVPTAVKWKLPEGFRAEPVMFPVPTRFMQPGNLIGYGYEKSVVLLTKVTPPSPMPPAESVDFAADVSWLVCKEVCVPGKVHLTGKLSEIDASTAAVVSQMLKTIPVPADQLASVTTDGSVESGRITVVVDWKSPAKNVTFFPGPNSKLDPRDIQLKADGSKSIITFVPYVYAGQTLTEKTLPSVVAYDDDHGERRGIQVDVPLAP